MSRLYGPVHRSLQDRFDTRRLADNVETRVVLTEIPQEHKAFIESRDMFFLSTIDHQGRPTVSYKGGDPGFVRVLGSKTPGRCRAVIPLSHDPTRRTWRRGDGPHDYDGGSVSSAARRPGQSRLAADKLNANGVPTPASGKWHATQVIRVRERLSRRA